MMGRGVFPRNFRISPRLTAWRESEIAAWQRARIAERDFSLIARGRLTLSQSYLRPVPGRKSPAPFAAGTGLKARERMRHIPDRQASQVGWSATNAISPILAVNAVPKSRAAFLLRAAARWQLFEIGEIELDEAFGGLVEQFEALVPCQCDREIIERWERAYPPQMRGRR